jgi:hypothetical protein
MKRIQTEKTGYEEIQIREDPPDPFHPRSKILQQ